MTGAALPRTTLAHLPTPLRRAAGLDALVGAEVWVKRDDATGGAEAGNKIRKLEMLLAAAQAEGADTVLTCGGTQSNHARATALTCAALGLRAVLFLRRGDGTSSDEAPPPASVGGNVLLDRLAGAEIRWISRAEYTRRNEVMASAQEELRAAGAKPYVVPEGGSNGLGALGYVEAMREVKEQMGDRPFDVIAAACGSGGTAAGIALGAARHGVAKETWAFAVCDDAKTFETAIARIVAEARALDPSLPAPAKVRVCDRARGPAYGVMDDAQRAFLASAVRASGLVFDPVYTGKALYGLSLAVRRGDIPPSARALFVHTGGLPGLLAQAASFGELA